jgi:Lar family restriction alleviation protein
MSEELKNCPFCGGVALVAKPAAKEEFYLVGCGDCGSATDVFERPVGAIDHWNRRAPDTLLDAIHVAVNEAIGGKVAASEIPKVIRERMK